jgi:pimeloyl-ACP methyl ester carboxylesterase
MDAEHIGSAAIVGLSVGSLIGQELALSIPRRVTSLVLVSTGTDGQQPLVETVQDLIQEEWQADFAPPGLLSRIQTETLAVPAGTWIGTVDDLITADNTQRLHHVTVPTLALWAVQDDVFSPAAEQKLIASLQVAASHGNPFYWKQYGALPPPDDGEQTDLGHNLLWEAPAGLARDIASFLRTGRPTCTEYAATTPPTFTASSLCPVRLWSCTVVHHRVGQTAHICASP